MSICVPGGSASLGALSHTAACPMKPGMQEQIRQFLHAEITKWAKVIKTADLTPG